jgi:hypothetical protein
MPSVRVTRGRLTASWLLLRTLQKLGGSAEASDALAYARRSSMRAGGLPIHDGVRLAREGGFILERAGSFELAPLGERALQLGTEDEPSRDVLRLFVSVLLLRDPPTWVAWWQGAPTDLDAVIPEAENRVLKEAGLLPQPEPSDPLAWGWWQALAHVPLPENTSAQRKEIGNAGEALSIEYERARLTHEGHLELAERVSWVAQESDAYGFDVLSFAGKNAGELPAETPIGIEVKSTTLPRSKVFRCFLTAHEWETAVGLGTRYRIHLWHGVRPGPPPASSEQTPTILPSSALADHLPRSAPCGDACDWQTARLELSLH